MQANDWSKDPRLSGLAPEKLQFLNEFAGRLSRQPKSQLMAAFTTMQMEANKRGIRFSNEETGAIIAVLSSGMTPEEKRRMEILRIFANKMAARKS